MNATIYIFGNFANGYSQYPDDYTRELFSSVSMSREGTTELVYHRDGNLIYYIYTREISRSANTFIGLCCLFNGILIRDFSHLFSIFENAITEMVTKGYLIEFTKEGNLSTKVNQLYTNTKEIQQVSNYLNNNFSILDKYVEKLPSINFSISNTECKTFSFSDITEVYKVINDYPNIKVIKEEHYETDSLKSYANTLQEINSENEKLKDEIKRLEKETSNPFTKKIILLLSLIILFVVGFLLSFGTFNSNKESLNVNQQIADMIEDLELDLESILPSTNISFPAWVSTNHGAASISKKEYFFTAFKGDSIRIPYYVSSEPNCDILTITLSGNGESKQLVSASGVKKSECSYQFPSYGEYRLIVQYSKDDGIYANEDRAGVLQFNLIHTSIPNINQKLKNLKKMVLLQ